MSKTLLSSLAVAALAFAAPALAAGPEAATTNAAAAADGAVVANAVQATPAGERRYCVVDTITGSRMPRKVCKTRKEWLGEGVDPLDK